MAEQIKIPYPHPNYDDDLLAKEIINGTYMASINMMIRNSQTGEERYVHVPDSPDIIKEMERGNEPDATNVNSVSDDPAVYDRNKMLEDAALPVYKDVENEEPIIISTAMTPKKIEYFGRVDVVIGGTSIDDDSLWASRYDDGINSFLVIAEIIDDRGTGGSDDDNIVGFYKIVGLDKIKLFEFDEKEYGMMRSIYSIGKRNFIISSDSYSDIMTVFEYNEDGFIEIREVQGAFSENLLRDKNNIYLLSIIKDDNDNTHIKIVNIDTGEIIISDFTIDYDIRRKPIESVLNNEFEFSQSGAYYIKDGKIYDKGEKYTPFAKTRFDYIRFYGFPMNVNEKRGNYRYPKANHSYKAACRYLGDVKEAYFSAIGDSLYWSRDYVNVKKIDIPNPTKHDSIAITKDYIYVLTYNLIDVFKVNEWGYVIPRNDMGELFAKHGMVDRGEAVIGD